MNAHFAACLSATMLVLLGLLHFAAAPKPIALRVRPLLAFAPSDLRIEVRLQSNPANRHVRVIADSGMFRRDSEWTVEGEHAQRLYSFWWKDLPVGDYVVTAAVASHSEVLAVDSCEVRLLGAP